MIKANFNAYDSYVTDSLYQWDLNQVLSVTGLNLAVVPEIHFSNANMERAIVRQSAMVNHVVSVGIPNSLLQDPLTIEADIGIYEGDTFKVVEKVLIPVIPKKRPSDYQIQDSDEEIYSFKALENAIKNMVKSSDYNRNQTSVNANITSVETTLNTRIDNIIANASDTGDNAELVDIRLDIDGNAHESAGKAVRKQFENIRNEAHALKTVTPVEFIVGSITAGVDEPNATRARIDGKIKACRAVVSFVTNSTYYYGYTTFNEDGEYDGVDHGWNAMTSTPLYLDNGYFKMNFKRADNAEITDEDLETLKSYVTITQFNILDDIEKLYLYENKGTPIMSPFNLETGSLSNGITVDMPNRARFIKKIKVTEKTVITFPKVGIYLYGYAFYDENGNYDGVDHGWKYPSNYPTIEFSAPGYVRLNFCRTDNANITDEDLIAIKDYLVIETYKNVEDLVNDLDKVSNELENKINTVENKNNAINSINIEYGRTNGASYVLARIPKICNNGNALRPKVRLTSEDGTLTGTKISALKYAQNNDTIFTVNAGLFDMSAMTPLGQTIIDGVSLTNTPMTDDNGTAISDVECYPLCIDANGDLSAPYARSVDTADMIADGIVHAVTGWGKIVDNFVACSDTVENEIVHAGTYIRQCIGQYQNGDYFICTVDMSRNTIENEAGITYADLAELLISKGVKFAYSLDGGGSAETVIEKRQINPIYEGTIGRAVPTVIVFDLN